MIDDEFEKTEKKSKGSLSKLVERKQLINRRAAGPEFRLHRSSDKTVSSCANVPCEYVPTLRVLVSSRLLGLLLLLLLLLLSLLFFHVMLAVLIRGIHLLAKKCAR